MCESVLSLGHCVVAETGCNWYLLDINIYSLSKKNLITTSSKKRSDEVLTRQCPCLRAFDSWSVCGRWRIQRLQTKTRVHMNLPRFGPPEGKDLHPACLILYCLYSWSCCNGGTNKIWLWSKTRRVLAYAREICARLDVYLSWPPLLVLIWGARSRDPVQVGYRWLQTLINLGLLGLWVTILFLDRSRYANNKDPRGRSLVRIISISNTF
jgi:hypothetical protein